MDITERFALIAERARILEQYIKDEISKEIYLSEMNRLDNLLA